MFEFLSTALLLCCWFNLHSCLQEIQLLAASPVCHNQSVMSSGCARRVLPNKDQRQCMNSCVLDTQCVGITVDDVEKDFCVVHYDCSRDRICSKPAKNRRFHSKNCAHDGRWVPSDSKCHCVNGWVGVRCQDIPKDYTDLLAAEYPFEYSRGYLDFRVKGLGLVPVVFTVSKTTGYHNVQLFQHNGNASFNRSRTEYENGFFIDSENFWCGFRTWSALIDAGYKTLYSVLNFKTKGSLWRVYKDVQLDASNGFAISFSKSFENGRGSISKHAKLGDCLGPFQHVPFSTFDRDVDGDSDTNCAATVGSGWWYTEGCTGARACNLFGWGPAHWGTSMPPNQRLAMPGVRPADINEQEFVATTIFIEL